jgi:transglutaminase-like putative cysteine protease
MALIDADRRLLVRLAMGGIALGTWCGAAAAGGADAVLLALLAGALVVAVLHAGDSPSTDVLAPGKDVVVLTGVTVAGGVALYLLGWADSSHLTDIAHLLPIGVTGLALLWPEPNVMRYSLLLAAGTLFGAELETMTSKLLVGSALVALAVALVATNRLVAASGPRLGGVAPARRRRLAGEATTVLVIVGLLAALAAALLPPPPGQGGGGLGGRRPQSLPGPAAPTLDPGRPLDLTAGRGAGGDDVVLLVGAKDADVWRATTYDHWDGQTWTRAPEDRTPLDDDNVAPGIGDVEGAAERLGAVQWFTVLARSASVLPAAARPTYASSRGLIDEGVDATLYPTSPLVRGAPYLVFSDTSQARGSVLRAAPAGEVPSDVADAYLQLPAVSPRIRALAAKVVLGRKTTYDRVRAVEGWIDDHTKVTSDASPVAGGADPLEVFLFEERSGSPERAATAMTVMLRALGIPTRMATGFLPGTRTGDNRQFLVRSRDAHAWVEVWFPSMGWQRFDPTGLAPDAHASDSVWDRLLRFLRHLWPLVLAAVVLGAAWLLWQGLRWRRRRAGLPWATRFFARVERAGAARGRPRRPQETPAEYAEELAAGPLPDPRLAEVAELVTVAAWSQHQPPAQDRARAEQVLRQATKATPARGRILAAVRRRKRRPRSQPPGRPTIAKP